MLQTDLNCVGVAITRGDMCRGGPVTGGDVGVGPGFNKKLHDVGVTPAGSVIHWGQAKLVTDIHINTGEPQEPLDDPLKQ